MGQAGELTKGGRENGNAMRFIIERSLLSYVL